MKKILASIPIIGPLILALIKSFYAEEEVERLKKELAIKMSELRMKDEKIEEKDKKIEELQEEMYDMMRRSVNTKSRKKQND